MPETNLSTNLGTALSIDLVENFGKRMKSLEELLGIARLMPLQNGSLIKTYTSAVTLDVTDVAPGAVIPLSEVKLEDGPVHEVVWDKKRKAVTVEDIQRFGKEAAITKTDEEFISKIQRSIRTKFFEQLATGTGTATGVGLQGTLAHNWAAVTNAFDEDVQVISFVNPTDAADYLAQANVTTQEAFGMGYLEGFMNNRIVFLHGDIPAGTVYSTAANNLIAAYVDMNNGDVKSEMDFVTDSTGLIGVTHDVNKQRGQTETIAMFGLVILAERLDGVVVGTITEMLP